MGDAKSIKKFFSSHQFVSSVQETQKREILQNELVTLSNAITVNEGLEQGCKYISIKQMCHI